MNTESYTVVAQYIKGDTILCKNKYCIAGKFGVAKVWRTYSYKVLARKSLANG